MKNCFYIILIGAMLSNTASAQSPSFNCAGDLSKIETSICQNPNLAKLDMSLSNAYKSFRKSPNAPETLLIDQRAWMKNRNTICGNSALNDDTLKVCLEAMYIFRLNKIQEPIDVNDIENIETTEDLVVPIKQPKTEAMVTKDDQTIEQMVEDNHAKLLLEGYAFFPSEEGSFQKRKKVRDNALKCARDLNNSDDVERRVCYNYSTDFGVVSLRIIESDIVCASVKIDDAPAHFLMTEEDGTSGLSYDDNTLIIKDMLESGNGVIYNTKRDRGALIIGGAIRQDMSECGVDY